MCGTGEGEHKRSPSDLMSRSGELTSLDRACCVDRVPMTSEHSLPPVLNRESPPRSLRGTAVVCSS